MEELLEACKTIFDECPQAVAVAHVLLDDRGQAYDFEFSYLNKSMAAFTDVKVEDLLGVCAYQKWGDDDLSWINHFEDAAFRGIACEFETAAILLEKFLHVTVIPLVEGYCTFVIDDVTKWLNQRSYDEIDSSSGLFFFDLRTMNVMLAPMTQKRYGFEKSYISATRFVDELFGQEASETVQVQLEEMRDTGRDIHYENRAKDGRWLRFNAGPIAQSERFVFCTIEDTTEAREAEKRSAHRMDVIESITRENFALYLIDLENNRVDAYTPSDDITGNGFVYSLVDETYEADRRAYLSDIVVSDDRDLVDAAISREALEALFLSDETETALTYRRMVHGEEQYVEARIIRLSGHDKKAVLAVRNTHSEMQEQLRQKHALQKALELAQHASAAKSTFLTNMSHDFRTPMNSIIGFTNLALEHSDKPEYMKECLQKIMRSSDHLLSLINDVLDVSRIESGVVESCEEKIDLVEFAAGLEMLFSGDVLRKSIDYKVDASGLKKRYVHADRQHIDQIMVNLIGNAFKFTEEGGSISVTISEYDGEQADFGSHVPDGYGRFDFVVSDTGCGMVPEFLERLFVPFERNGLGKPNKIEGTGLGMPITKNLVELLGGSIEVKSRVGEGSEFCVTLPLRLADEGVDKRNNDDLAEKQTDVQDETPSQNEKQNDLQFCGKRIMVVDDDELGREIMRAILTAIGFEVDEAEDGMAAVELAGSSEPGQYDAILMDMRMPRMSGDDAARAIHSIPRDDLRDIPIFALTADAFEEGRRRSHEAGMVAHITKPFKRAELLKILETYIR